MRATLLTFALLAGLSACNKQAEPEPSKQELRQEQEAAPLIQQNHQPVGARAMAASPIATAVSKPSPNHRKQVLTNSEAQAPETISEQESAPPKIVIIIDDLGYDLEGSKKLAQLLYPLTLAIIPNSPHAQRAAELAIEAGHELILHIPMEPLNTDKWEDGLNTSMDKTSFDAALKQLLEQHPWVVGVNNHGGSKLTADRERMDWLMQSLADKELFFIDSRTNAASQAANAALAAGLPHSERDVFIDHEISAEAIGQAFVRLRKIARQHGQAIAIGHPHDLTLNALRNELPALEKEGFELHYASEALNINRKQSPELALGTAKTQSLAKPLANPASKPR
ncbi:divergent polysaccharide deacetylase family protein [Agaribacterium haliotis]|uniref:divergent polysaccharide deacetylase family protein n=1 Tax=Agaribacterium haliotis TaxID=2013869 RepID=UPI000BB58F69|nr:divergent polysaccharide deacetylase family protein [Agaribacterium haliotis]